MKKAFSRPPLKDHQSSMKQSFLFWNTSYSKITDSLLNRAAISFNNSPFLHRAPRKTYLEKPLSPLHLRKLPPFESPSPQNFRWPPWGEYGYFLELHIKWRMWTQFMNTLYRAYMGQSEVTFRHNSPRKQRHFFNVHTVDSLPQQPGNRVIGVIKKINWTTVKQPH